MSGVSPIASSATQGLTQEAVKELDTQRQEVTQSITIEAETGLRWAQLLARLRASGRAMPIKDSLVAATALVHGLVVATRNRADFEKAGVEVVDPSGG